MTTYYVDPAGSDAAAGTSPATAWQTTAKVNSATLANGDTILFKRGGVWRGAIDSMINDYSYSGVTFGAYGTGANPILSGGDLVTGWSVSSGSTYQATRTSLPGTPKIVTWTIGGVTTQLQLGSGSGSLTANQFYWSGTVLYVHLGGTNPATGTIEVAARSILNLQGVSNCTVQNIDLRYSCDGGIAWTGSPSGGLLVDSCNFQWCTQTTYNGAVYIRNGAPGGRVLHCTFDQMATESVYTENVKNVEVGWCTITNAGGMIGDQQTDGIQMEQNAINDNGDGFWFHDNYISMGSQTVKGGIQLHVDRTLSGTSGTGIVERNTIIGGNFGVGLYASGVTVRNNIIHGQSATNQSGVWMDPGGARTNCVITYNLIYNCDIGISNGTGALNQQLTIAHNTIVDCTRQHVWLDSPIYGIIKNNIFWNRGANPTVRCFSIASIAAGQTLAIDYNLYNTAFTNYLRLGATDYSTLAAWKAGTGQDAHSISGDPLFNNATAGDYTLTVGSPAIDAGVVIAGINQVIGGAAPDMGALEVPTPTLDPGVAPSTTGDPNLGKSRAERILSYLPPYFQEDPQVLAYVRVCARELDRIEAAAVALRTGAFPSTADLRTLAYYERLFGLTNTALSVAARRTDIVSHMRKRSVASRFDWQAALEAFIASPGGWSYAEVPTYQVNLTVPVDPAGSRVPVITAFARAVTPAHLTLLVNGTYGTFQVGISHIGDPL